jgi:hypothetical protein
LHRIHPPTPFPCNFLPTVIPHCLFCPSVPWFCKRKRKEEKKGGGKWHFLLVWHKGSYTGKFLVIFPCVYVL